MIIEKDFLVNEFSKYLNQGNGAFFIGSGISYKTIRISWLDLIKKLAQSLYLDITEGEDLPQIAQYIVNLENGNRYNIGNIIKTHFSKDYKISDYHQVLKKINVKTIWTTNYDTLLEQTFSGQLCTVKYRDSLMTTKELPTHIEIIKMHGCAKNSSPEEFVITKEDYEDFEVNKPLITRRLCHDLIEKSFLFIGYSYNDENIKQIVSTVRRITNKIPPTHFLIQKKESEPDLIKRQILWAEDLSRYGFSTLLIEDYQELFDILISISCKSRGNSVFITGSHLSDSDFSRKLGKRLAEATDFVLINGQSSGIGKGVLNGFIDESIRIQKDFYSRLKLFPNPYTDKPGLAYDMSYIGELKKARTKLIQNTQVIIVFPGGMGTKAEVQLAREYSCVILPVKTSAKNLIIDELLCDKEIMKRLKDIDCDYYNSLLKAEITTEDIIRCLKKLMK